MTRIVDVLLNNESEKGSVELSRRQILFEETDLPTMILEFEDLSTCLACETKESSAASSSECRRSHGADSQPVGSSGVVVEATSSDLSESLCQVVPCISCRLSLERLYKQLVPKTADAKVSLALDPIQINHEGKLAINAELLTNMTASTDKLDKELEAIASKSVKKNKRCAMHSTEANGSKGSKKNLEDWRATWNLLSLYDCTSKLLSLDAQKLLESLNVYLRKNKFCSDCRLKVLFAYMILTKKCESDDATYDPSLYENIKCCSTHVHIRNDIGYIEQLIFKSELEILGGRPERHATTINSAQEEVLVCIGAFLYERIIKIGQSLTIQAHNWNMLFHVSLSCLVKNAQAAEIKHKEFDVDLICAELDAFDKQKRDQQARKQESSVKKKSKAAPKKTKQPSDLAVAMETTQDAERAAGQSSSKADSRSSSKRSNSSSKKSSAEETSYHTCLSSAKSAKLKMTKGGVKQCRILSTKGRELDKRAAKPRKNIELNLSDELSCKCDDEAAFSHHSDDGPIHNARSADPTTTTATSKCTNSCCFDIIEYWNKLTANFGAEAEDDEGGSSDLDEKFRITDEEKDEYFANKAFYLTVRTQRREMLKERFEEFKLRSVARGHE